MLDALTDAVLLPLLPVFDSVIGVQPYGQKTGQD
jgi:hypothetical protein